MQEERELSLLPRKQLPLNRSLYI